MEQRNQIYQPGDTIRLRKNATDFYTVKIDAVEVEKIDTMGIYTIKFSINDVEYDNKREKFFNYFETESGREIKDFTILNEGVLQINLPSDEKLKMIVLKSPDYEGSMRRVHIGDDDVN